ncbi:ribosomal protein L13e, partial [Salmonella sp. s54836]|uniref:ribosomal protein L13e n=1 Tax=Salmonella sp. s54836 TaxID=3159673 RepID=UPI0039800EF9
EVRQAGIPKKLAITIGICVDHRRKNRSLESLQSNVKRLKEYKSRLVLFPVNKKKPKLGDSSQAECETVTQSKAKNLLPLKRVVIRERPREIKKHEKRLHVYSVLRQARSEAKNVGKHLKTDSKKKGKKKK